MLLCSLTRCGSACKSPTNVSVRHGLNPTSAYLQVIPNVIYMIKLRNDTVSYAEQVHDPFFLHVKHHIR